MKKKINITKLNRAWDDSVKISLGSNLMADDFVFVRGRPETKKEKNARLRKERAEVRRRAKKITMTVGEYEDALEKERDYDY